MLKDKGYRKRSPFARFFNLSCIKHCLRLRVCIVYLEKESAKEATLMTKDIGSVRRLFAFSTFQFDVTGVVGEPRGIIQRFIVVSSRLQVAVTERQPLNIIFKLFSDD